MARHYSRGVNNAIIGDALIEGFGDFCDICLMAKASKAPTDMSEIAERLRITREAAGLKQAPWCRLTGVSTSAWNNYEGGTRRISLDEALKVCTATGVTLDWIYRGQANGLPMNFATEIQRLRNAPPLQPATRKRAS